MPFRRKIVTAGVSVVCGLALAACGQQVVAHISATDTVHSALDGVFTSGTNRFVITAQGLPGTASLADGSFSVVVTTSGKPDASTSTSSQPAEISIYHETTDLVDLLSIDNSMYFRIDAKDIAAISGPSEYGMISSEINMFAARPGFGFLHDVLLGNWVGISMSNFLALEKQLEGGSTSAQASISKIQKLTRNTAKLKQLRSEVQSSLMQSIKTWLSIHQKGSGEYSLNLPVRPFVNSVVGKLAKPVEAFLSMPAVPQSEVTQALAKIPADLSLNANLWISKGSLTKVQAFIPKTTAYLMIGVSHPSTGITAPTGATMLSTATLKLIFASLKPSIPKVSSISGLASVQSPA